MNYVRYHYCRRIWLVYQTVMILLGCHDDHIVCASSDEVAHRLIGNIIVCISDGDDNSYGLSRSNNDMDHESHQLVLIVLIGAICGVIIHYKID